MSGPDSDTLHAPYPGADFKLVLRQVGSQLPEDGIAALLTRYAPAGSRPGTRLDAAAFRNDLRAASTAAGAR